MLEILNRYAHGLVLVPVVDALRRAGVLERLEKSPTFRLPAVAAEFSMNGGYLAVAAQLFESLGWLRSVAAGVYQPTASLAQHRAIPADAMEIYDFPFGAYLEGNTDAGLGPCIERSKQRWGAGDEFLADCLDGVFIIPALLAAKAGSGTSLVERRQDGRSMVELRFEFPQKVAAELRSLFLQKSWASSGANETLCLTHAGQFVWRRIMITAALAAYRPMLKRMGTLLFGDPATVFGLDAAGHELHLDRTLNVLGSGFQHVRFFEAMQAAILPVFDAEPIEEQPDYIVDTGCGDGTLLRTLYDCVRTRTRRGKFLAERPITLIGVDCNQKALAEATKKLSGYPHCTVTGDIAAPQAIAAALRSIGVTEADRVLHVRSFLDHDRPYMGPVDVAAAGRWRSAGLSGVHVDRAGQLIDPADVAQSTVEHLRRWAGVLGRHGLLLLEVHCEPPATTARFLDESESLHFDAYHAMSRQYLLEARIFLECAAQAGLLQAAGTIQRFPRGLRYVRVGLHHFNAHNFLIRRASNSDPQQIERLPILWGEPLPLPLPTGATPGRIRPDVLQEFVVIAEDTVIGAVTCRIRSGAPPGEAEDGAVLVCLRGVPDLPASPCLRLLEFVTNYFGLQDVPAQVAGLEECRTGIHTMMAQGPQLAVGAGAVLRSIVSRADFAARNDPHPAETQLGEFVLRWIAMELAQLGGLRPGRTYDRPELYRRIGAAEKHVRCLDGLFARLQHRGLVGIEADRVTILPAYEQFALQRSAADAGAFAAAHAAGHPEFAAAAHLACRCLPYYSQILTGRVSAAEVIFADDGTDTFEALFHGEPASDFLNDLIVGAVRESVRRLRLTGTRGGRPIQILEVGAGSGATSRAILEQVVRDCDDVCFTFSDVSPAFVRRSRARLAEDHPSVQYLQLDIEADLAPQGVQSQSYDVVVAANVLHDTANIANTLAQLRRMLKPGALLVISEYTQIKEWFFGMGALLHGPWLFDDAEVRLPHFCLLSVAQWRTALGAAGFRNMSVHALPTQDPEGNCGQAVLVAESPAAAGAGEYERPEAVGAEARKEWPVEEYAARSGAGSFESGADADRPDAVLRRAVEADLLAVLGAARARVYSPTRPLMESGLDSVELVEFKARLGERFQTRLPPTFLFEHETVAKVVRALGPMLSEEQLSAGVCDLAAERHHPPAAQQARATAAARGETQARLKQATAVIGMACRFPGDVSSEQAYWRLIDGAADAISIQSRCDWPSSAEARGARYALERAGFLTRIDEFDAAFFRISRTEAQLMDPQQRLLLELTWEALEDAAIPPSSLAGREVGVFIGACHADYRDLLVTRIDWPEAYVGSGSARSILANRISYLFDFSGPSETIDTACSSSLVSVHRAIQALNAAECELAVVGGVNLICSPTNTIAYYRAGMLSPTGTCRAFDALCDGYVRGEGGALLLLKPAEAAIRDGNPILGLILGTAVNHGGQSASLTAPKPVSQAGVIERAMIRADVDPDTVRYIEAHGTGTTLGDPVEVAGLVEAYRRLRSRRSRPAFAPSSCALGTVKANIGHLEGAAGVAGLIKSLLVVKNGRIPKMLHFENINPHIDFADSPFYVPAQAQDWDEMTGLSGERIPRRAAVSSFGFGGVNAHAVVQEWVPFTEPSAAIDCAPLSRELVVLSAKTSASLTQSMSRLLEHIGNRSERLGMSLQDVAHTLRIGREALPVRAAFVVSGWGELESALRRHLDGAAPVPATAAPTRPAVEKALAAHDLEAIATWWARGVDIDLSVLYARDGRRLVPLPKYSFEKERYWVPSLPEEQVRAAEHEVGGKIDAPAQTDTGAPGNRIEGLLADMVAELLRIPRHKLEVGARFRDIGLDSIGMVSLADGLARQFGLSIADEALDNHTTVRSLAAYLIQNHQEAMNGAGRNTVAARTH